MFFLRFVAVVALALWIGGLTALGGGARTIFAVLQAHDPTGGRELAGLLFGELFGQAQYAFWACGGAVIASLGARAALGPRPRRVGLRLWIVITMTAASLATTFVIAPRIDAIRGSVDGPVASLPDSDGRKQTFGRLHGLSNVLVLLTLGAGVGLLWSEIRDGA